MDRLQRTRWAEFAIEALIRVLGFSTIGFVLLIFLFLLREGVPVFFEVTPANLFGTRWYPTFDLFGTLPLILGSALVTVTAIAIALPLGVATAVFVREVAPGWAREILKPMIEVLAGLPSVVLGFFGMTVIAPLVRETLGAPTPSPVPSSWPTCRCPPSSAWLRMLSMRCPRATATLAWPWEPPNGKPSGAWWCRPPAPASSQR